MSSLSLSSLIAVQAQKTDTSRIDFKKLQDDEFQRSLKQMDHNMDNYMAAKREAERKQTQQLWIRLGLVALVGVFFTARALRRKKKQVS